MQRHVAIATSRAAEHKGWSCRQSLSPLLPAEIAQREPSEQLPCVFSGQLTCQVCCPFDRATFIQERWESEGLYSRCKRFPIVRARQPNSFPDRSHANLPICMHETKLLLPVSFQRHVPALLNNRARKSARLLQRGQGKISSLQEYVPVG